MLLMDRGSIAELMRVARGGLLGDENSTYGPMNGAMPAPQVPLQNAGMGQPPTAGPIAMAPPSLPAMPQAPQGPGLLSRINDFGRPELPEGMASLLSPAEQRKATGGLLKRIGTQILGLGLFTPEIQAQARAGMMIGAKKAAREYGMEVDAEQQRKAMEEGRKALVASIDWTQPGAGQEYVSGMMRLGANPKDMASAYRDLAPGEQDKPQSLGSGFIWNPATRKVERLDVPGEVEREVVDGVLYEKTNGRWVPQTQKRVDTTGRYQLVQNDKGEWTRLRVDGPEGPTGVRGKMTGVGSGRIQEVLPTVLSTVGKLEKYDQKKIDALSTVGVNAATTAQKTSDTPLGMAGAWAMNKTLISPADAEYAQLIRGISDAVARANEVGILTNQDIQRYESQVSFVAGEPESMKPVKVANALAWANWIKRNRTALAAGDKEALTPPPIGDGSRGASDSKSDYERAFDALGDDATDEQISAWVRANAKRP